MANTSCILVGVNVTWRICPEVSYRESEETEEPQGFLSIGESVILQALPGPVFSSDMTTDDWAGVGIRPADGWPVKTIRWPAKKDLVKKGQ